MSVPNMIDDKTMLCVGTTLQMGKYRIDRYISSGGFGNTYLATNISFNEQVAIKEFFMKGINQREGQTTVSVSNQVNNPHFVEQKEKFKKEARRLRNLHSEHIVAVSDLFDENGTTYYVMDYIDGESLRDKVKRLGRLSEEEMRDYLLQVLDALEEVHRQMMFHLDLKPANIMVDKTGRVRIIDFGASKQQKSEGGATSKSAMCYTPGYAPIEQKDQQFEKFGPWTDLYALGATLYNVLTGDQPPTTNAILDEAEDAFRFPVSISKEMQELIIWMMRSARRKRPQSVQEVREYLGVNEFEQKPPVVSSSKLEQFSGSDDDDGTILGDTTDNDQEEQENSDFNAYDDDDTGKNKKRIMIAVIGGVLLVLLVWLMIPRGQASSSDIDQLAEVDSVEAVMAWAESEQFNNKILGDYLYTGVLNDNGNPQGEGEAVFLTNGNPDGRTYKGNFEDGVFQSDFAEYKFSNGDTYRGSFKNNYFDKGTLKIASSGEYFEGYFSQGQPHIGTWYSKQNQVLEKIGQ